MKFPVLTLTRPLSTEEKSASSNVSLEVTSILGPLRNSSEGFQQVAEHHHELHEVGVHPLVQPSVEGVVRVDVDSLHPGRGLE